MRGPFLVRQRREAPARVLRRAVGTGRGDVPDDEALEAGVVAGPRRAVGLPHVASVVRGIVGREDAVVVAEREAEVVDPPLGAERDGPFGL